MPDTNWAGNDDAHRQRVVCANKGNRIGENTTDPSGALKRQLSRSIDALGRVQQTTGRE